MMRVRSSPRCSMRVMPGSSARSVTAARARSTRSSMDGGLAWGIDGVVGCVGGVAAGGIGVNVILGFDVDVFVGIGELTLDVGFGAGHRKASGRRHKVEVPGGGY